MSTFHKYLRFLFSASDSRLFDRTSFVVNIIKQLITYIAQYPILRIAQSALHFTSWQTCSTRFLWKASSQAAVNARRPFVYYSTMPLAIYALVQLSELEHCRMEEFPRFDTAAHDYDAVTIK